MERSHQRLQMSDLPMYLGYAVSTVTFAAGAVIVSGLVLDARLPAQFRIMFGIVFMLMGVYRFVLTRAKIRQWRTEQEDEEL